MIEMALSLMIISVWIYLADHVAAVMAFVITCSLLYIGTVGVIYVVAFAS